MTGMAPLAPGSPELGNERLLVDRARAGDRAAFEQLVRAHQARVRGQLRRLLRGDTAAADDLAQETFVQAWCRLGDFRGDSRWSTWLHRVALSRYLMHLRQQHHPVGTAGQPPMADDPPPDAAGSEPVAPGGGERDTMRRLDVAKAIDQLPPDQRLAVIHCYQLDLSHEEAAEVLGWPLGTLKSHIARAKPRLRESLADWKPEETP